MNFKKNTEVILAEYSNVRGEIEQLNRQVFSVLTSSITVNIAVMGWLLGKENPSEFYLLPTIGILLLFWGNAILLNRNRLAHRLALFQKHFIEPRLPDLCWGRVYSAYRDRYPEKGFISNLKERLADSGSLFLIFTSIINLFIIVALGIKPFLNSGSTQIDWLQVINVILAIVPIWLQEWLRRIFTDYRVIDNTLRDLSRESGLPAG